MLKKWPLWRPTPLTVRRPATPFTRDLWPRNPEWADFLRLPASSPRGAPLTAACSDRGAPPSRATRKVLTHSLTCSFCKTCFFSSSSSSAIIPATIGFSAPNFITTETQPFSRWNQQRHLGLWRPTCPRDEAAANLTQNCAAPRRPRRFVLLHFCCLLLVVVVIVVVIVWLWWWCCFFCLSVRPSVCLKPDLTTRIRLPSLWLCGPGWLGQPDSLASASQLG